MNDSHFIQFVFDFLCISILIKEGVSYDEAAFFAHYVFQFIKSNRQAAFFEVNFFRGSHPEHVFSPLSNSLDIDQVFYTNVFRYRVSTPGTASKCQRRSKFEVVEVSDTTLRRWSIDKNTVRWLEYNGLGGYIQDYRMHLFEPGTVKEEDLEKFKTELKDVIAYVKYSKSTEALKDYNEKYKPDLTKSTVTLINELTNSKYVFIEGKERLDMCEAFEGLIEEGRAKGKAEELKEKYKSWVTLSNNLKKRGMSNPEIASLLGVPETELQKAFKMIKEEKTEKMNMK